MSLLDALLWALVIIPIFSWLAAAILIYKALRKPYITALVERAFIALLTSVASTVIAFLVLNSYRHWVHLESPWTLALLVLSLLLLELPALIWFVLYLTVYRGSDDLEVHHIGWQHRLDVQDREVGDKRRELQARDSEEES